MYDELTEVDIKKMEEEIAYRTNVLGPQLLKEMSRTREYGDLSENAEYKEAKREKRKNEGRIRYLTAMIRTAKVIEVGDREGVVNLFDKVKIFNEKAGAEKKIQMVTTLRQNALLGFVSKESPLGSALMGKKVGDRAEVVVNASYSYFVVIKNIEKIEDDSNDRIRSY